MCFLNSASAHCGSPLLPTSITTLLSLELAGKVDRSRRALEVGKMSFTLS